MSWTEQRFRQAVRRGELKYFPRCARSFLYFRARKMCDGNRDLEKRYYTRLLSLYKLNA